MKALTALILALGLATTASAQSSITLATANAGTIRIQGDFGVKNGLEAFWISSVRHGVSLLPMSTRSAAMFDTGDLICQELGYPFGVRQVLMGLVDNDEMLETVSYNKSQDEVYARQFLAADHPDRAFYGSFVRMTGVECAESASDARSKKWTRLR